MEVGNPLFRLVINSDPREVELHQEPGLFPLQVWEELIGRFLFGEPAGKHRHQLRMEREHVDSPVFRARGLDGYGGLLSLQVETFPSSGSIVPR